MHALTTIVNTRTISYNPIKVKLPNSSTMASTHQYQIPLQNLSREAYHAEVLPTLHFSLMPIRKLFDYEDIVVFDKHRVVLRKKCKYY